MGITYTFRAEERLKSKKIIADLFENGNSFHRYPLRVIWKLSEENTEVPARAAVSVSKKSFKKAVHRNRIKRLMKEAWRLNKHILYNELGNHNKGMDLMIVFTGNDMPEYSLVLSATKEAVSKLLVLLQEQKPGT